MDFYTRVLGLKLQLHASRRAARLQQGDPTSHLGDVGEAGPVQQDGHDLPEGAAGAHVYFRVNHRRIAPYRKNTRGRARDRLSAVVEEQSGEMYFMARLPVQEIFARLQAWQQDVGMRLLHHAGTVQNMRILRLRDPDGNRLHLIELG